MQIGLKDTALERLHAIRNDSDRIFQLLVYARDLEDTKPSEAITIERNATAEAARLQLRNLQLRGLWRLGRVYYKNGDYIRSLNYFLEQLKLAGQLQDHLSEIDALKEISIIYLRMQDKEKSLRYLHSAYNIARRYGIKERMPDLLTEQGIRYAEAKQYDSALAVYREAIALAKEMNHPGEELSAAVNMATVLKNLKRYNEALEIYKRALQTMQAASDGESAAIIMNNIAHLYFESGSIEQSEQYALQTLRHSDTLKDSRNYIQQDVYRLLVKLYESKGEFKQAFEASQRLSSLKDTLFNKQSAEELQEASVRFDTELKDAQIAAQQSQIQYRNRLTIFLTGGILLLLGAGTVIYVNQLKVRRLNRQVVAQKGELEKLNSVKDRIFSAISHDIRTPLSSLFSFSRLLSEGNISEQKLPLYTAQLNSQLSYTMGLMDNLLHWARSQMQGFQPVIESLDLHQVVSEVLRNAAEGQQKGIQVMQNIAKGMHVYADRQVLMLILRNLIHNAIKFTPKGGSIVIAGTFTDQESRLSVADTGVGIDAATVAAFNAQEPMQSRPGTSGEKGTGLGLLLCKSLAAAMKGSIALSSQLGKGSCFVLVLPAGNQSLNVMHSALAADKPVVHNPIH